MTDVETVWKRFASRHLGTWQGSSTHVDVSTMEVVRMDSYVWTMGAPTFAPREVRVTATVEGDTLPVSDVSYRVGVGQNGGFFAFEDGCYCAQHEMLEFPGAPLARLTVELCVILSSTERVRSLLLYDFENVMRRVVVLREVRDELWEERYPTSLLSLVGKWKGEALSARMPSLGAGTISYHTSSSLLWDYSSGVRESFAAMGADGQTVDRMSAYGTVDDGGDFTAIDWRGGLEKRRTFLVGGAAYITAPLNIPPGTAWLCELVCLITERCRRRIKRLHDQQGSPVSHSSLLENKVT